MLPLEVQHTSINWMFVVRAETSNGLMLGKLKLILKYNGEKNVSYIVEKYNTYQCLKMGTLCSANISGDPAIECLPCESLCDNYQPAEDPLLILLIKLTEYINRLQATCDNIVAEKLTAEVQSVLIDPSQVDHVNRAYKWSKTDEARLTRLTSAAKSLEAPASWSWNACPGSRQFDFNYARLKLAVTEQLEFKLHHCEQCKTTSVLIGIDEMNANVCIDCTELNQTRPGKTRSDKESSLESVLPFTLDYPALRVAT